MATTSRPLYSILVGTNDLALYGIGPNEALFNLCHRSALAWLGIARPYKVLAGDPSLTIRSGSWTASLPFGNCCTDVLANTTGGGTLRFTLTTNGGAAFLWYVLQSTTTGSFAVSIDGGTYTAPTSTLLPPTLDAIPGSYAVLRLPVSAGTHTFDITAQSGTISILGMGSAPPVSSSSILPTVLATDVPNQLNGSTAGIAEYTSDIQSNIALLQGDGLDIRFVPTQHSMFATASEMVDLVNPNALGLSEIAQAFVAAVTPAHPAADTLSVATASFTTSTLPIGTHTIAMSYSGDSKYAAAQASPITTTIYDSTSIATLTSDASIYSVQSPLTLTAAISPSSATGAVDFTDITSTGDTALGSGWVGLPTPNGVILTLPSLSAGPHTLVANYLGDNEYSSSASPAIQIEVSGTYTTTLLTAANTRFLARAPVALTASVTPASSGTFTFFDGATTLAQSPSLAGTATLSSASLAPGIHSLSAAFSGNSTQDPSQSPALAIEIDPNPTILTLTASPASQPYGGSIALLATVSPALAAGTVTITDAFLAPGSSQPIIQTLGQPTVANGTASLSLTNPAPGTHTFNALYSGDIGDLPSTSQPVTAQIALDTSVTALTAIPTAVTYATPLQLAAVVTPATATGTITFSDSIAGTLAHIAIANGTASFSTSSLAPGPHTISATYSGDNFRATSTSAALTTTVSPLTSTIVLAPLPATIYAGNPLTLTTTISPPTATGTVIFRDATLGVLGSASVSKGAATLTLPNPTVTAYSIIATYSGDTFDTPATSAAITPQVALNTATTTFTASANPAPAASPVTLIATVTPASTTGTVTFLDGVTTIGTVLLSGGKASLTTSTLSAALHALRATYSGDTVNASSTSATLNETITGDTTSTTLTLAQTSVIASSTVVANVHVTSTYTTPTGTITLRSGSTIVASGPLANASTGTAYATLTFNSATLGLGSFPLIATCSGDNADQSSDSSATPITLTVLPIPTTLALNLSATSTAVQHTVTLTAIIAATSAATGSVTFLSNGNAFATVPVAGTGIASTVFTATAVGTYSLTSTYTPTGFFASTPATAPQTITVLPPVSLSLTPDSVTGSPGSTASATLLITPNFGFTGPIQTQCQTTATWIACTVNSPATIAGATPVSVPVQITIAQSTAAISPRKPVLFAAALAFLLPLLIPRGKRSPLARLSLIVILVFAANCITACNANTFSFPPGAQSATITVTAAGTSTTATLPITVGQ